MKENEISINEKFLELVSDSTPRKISSRIPQSLYFYFPKGNEIIEFDEKNSSKTLRRIFEGNIEYLPFEIEKLEGFIKYIDELNSTKNESERFYFPNHWKHADTLRNLQSCEYDYAVTLPSIINYINWREKILPVQPSNKICEILNTGSIYSHGRDNKFRPNIVLRVKDFKLNYEKFIFDDWVNSITFILEYAIKNLLINGQIENWNIIVDCSDASIFSLPPEIKMLLQVLQNNYKCRLHTMYILNLSIFFRAIWLLIRNVLDPQVQKKIQIIPPNSNDLFVRINRSQTEEKYGGTSKTITDYYFPHIQPSENFFVEGDDENEIFMSENDYLDLVKRDDKIQKSPYYLYEIPQKSNGN